MNRSRWITSLILACFTLLFTSASARYENGMINIGLLTLDPFALPGGLANYTGPLGIQSAETIQAYTFWADQVNSYGGIQVGSTYMLVNLTVIQIGSSAASQMAASAAAAATGDYDFFFGPFSSNWDINVGIALAPYNSTVFFHGAAASNVFQCGSNWASSPPCTANGARRFPHGWGLLSPAEHFMQSPINQLALQGAKTIAGWYQNEFFCQGFASGTISDASSAGIAPLQTSPFAMALNATQADYDTMAQTMADLDPDIVVGGSRVGSCVMFLAAIKKINWMPRAFMASLCGSDPSLNQTLVRSNLTLTDAAWIIDTVAWDVRLKGPAYTDSAPFFYQPTATMTSTQLFYSTWLNASVGTFDISVTPLAVAAGYALHEAIVRAGSIDNTLVTQSLQTELMNSFFGYIGFNAFGQNSAKENSVVQLSANASIEIISPLGSSTSQLAYPMPSWTDRTFVVDPYGWAGEKAIAVLTGVAIMFTLAMGIATFVFRNSKAIVASSPVFLFGMLLGSLLLYAGILTWTLTTTDALCMAHWWLLGLGFILMFGSLLVKVWRISRIFNLNDLSLIRISNAELFTVVGIMLGFELVLLILWVSIGPSKSIQVPTDVLRPALNYMACSSTPTSTVILAIMAGYKGLIIIAGIYLSARTWKIKYSVYNESRSVAFSMYNLFFFLALAIIVELVINGADQRKTQFIVRSIMILLGTFVPIAVLFIPKFTRPEYLDTDNVGTKNSASKTSKTSKATTGSAAMSSKSISDYDSKKSEEMTKQDEEKDKLIARQKEQISRLKKEVRDLRSKLANLNDDEESSED